MLGADQHPLRQLRCRPARCARSRRLQAASIETVDSTVLALARNDIVWHEVRGFFPDDPEGPADGRQPGRVPGRRCGRSRGPARAHHGDAGARRQGCRAPRLHGGAGRGAGRRQHAPGGGAQGGLRLAEDGDEAEADHAEGPPASAVNAVERIWAMRKKSVGLLGNMAGQPPPHPFRRRHGRAAGAPRRLHRRVPRRCSTAAGSSTACSATSMRACCTSARRST